LLEEKRSIIEDINSTARSLQLVMRDRANELVVILSGRRDEVGRFAVRDGARHQHSDMIRGQEMSRLKPILNDESEHAGGFLTHLVPHDRMRWLTSKFHGEVEAIDETIDG